MISFSIVDVHSTSSVLGVLPSSMDTFWHEALLGRVGKFQEGLFVLIIWSVWKEQNQWNFEGPVSFELALEDIIIKSHLRLLLEIY